jgi:hypothetical protein
MAQSRLTKIKAISVFPRKEANGKMEHDIYIGTIASEIFKFVLKEVFSADADCDVIKLVLPPDD